MEKNVGGLDRKLRLVIGAALVLLGAAGYAGLVPVATNIVPQALTSVILALAGLALLATAITRKCMVNSMLGRNTAKG